MTCIAAVVHEGKVWMGADSAGVAWYDLTVRADQKVFKTGAFLMGFTSSFRMGQLLRYKFTPPHHHPDVEVYKYMVNQFVDEVRECLKKGGYARTVNGEEEGGSFLVGYQGRLFQVWDDYQVGEGADPFYATGCGASFAQGVLYATGDLVPEVRIRKALEGAERMSAGVRGPFHIMGPV